MKEFMSSIVASFFAKYLDGSTVESNLVVKLCLGYGNICDKRQLIFICVFT